MLRFNTVELLVKSDVLAQAASQISAGTPAKLAELEGKLRYAESRTTTTGTTTTSGSTYLALRLPSAAVLKYGTIQGVGSVDLPDVDVGVRQVSTPNTLVDDAFATALDIDDTGDHVFIGQLGSQDTAKAMWEWAGLTEDPGGMFDIHVSLDADAVVAGVFVTKVYYTVE